MGEVFHAGYESTLSNYAARPTGTNVWELTRDCSRSIFLLKAPPYLQLFHGNFLSEISGGELRSLAFHGLTIYGFEQRQLDLRFLDY